MSEDTAIPVDQAELLRPEVDVAGLAPTLQALGMGHQTLAEMTTCAKPLWRRTTARGARSCPSSRARAGALLSVLA